ncbi:MAG: hypothetical protein MJY72_06365 [Bacteroidales bacterium]|nr:hypothetical protein [Bacteroidales bacterium]
MKHSINFPFPAGWNIEEETVLEDGMEVETLYATKGKASIELYVGDTPEGSDAFQECMFSYAEAFGAKEGDELPIGELPFLGQTGAYYDAEDDNGNPVIVICVEPKAGTLVMAILGEKDDDSLDDLMSLVDENLKVE